MYEYPKPSRVRRGRGAKVSQDGLVETSVQSSRQEASVVTVLEPSIRSRLDAAGEGLFATIHADTVHDATRAVRGPSVRALLLSPKMLGQAHLPGVNGLMSASTGVITVAVVSDHEPGTGKGLLDLGASGVRRYVDLSGRDGWNKLRSLIGEGSTESTVEILAAVMPVLGDAHVGSKQFFDLLIRSAPRIRSIKGFARSLRIHSSTLMSRFFRAGLPSPKQYLGEMRMLYAAALFETSSTSIAEIAHRLDYSSPQSFGRTVRTVKGMPASAFRRSSFSDVLEQYMKALIVPYRATFLSFDPLGHSDGVRSRENAKMTEGQISRDHGVHL